MHEAEIFLLGLAAGITAATGTILIWLDLFINGRKPWQKAFWFDEDEKTKR